MDPISVLICDDHAPFRRGLRSLLDTSTEIQVVAEAADGAEAVAVAVRTQPDVVLMDLTMPGVGGVQATRDVLAACQREYAQGIARRRLERQVARHGREREQLHLRAREREQDGDRVVHAGVAIDDERRGHRRAV